MAKSILPVSVENRLKAQSEILYRLAVQDEGAKQATQPAPFITISRQYGCMAHALAENLAQRLDASFPEWAFSIYDREMLEVMAEHETITTGVMNSFPERTRGVVEDLIGELVAKRPPETRVFRHLATTLCSIAALGQAILVGRGGAAITRKIPAGIHVRLVAPIDWRVESLKSYPERVAGTAEVKLADRERESFVRKYLGVDINDPDLYHLILNNQLLTTEEETEIIVKLVQERCGKDSGR